MVTQNRILFRNRDSGYDIRQFVLFDKGCPDSKNILVVNFELTGNQIDPHVLKQVTTLLSTKYTTHIFEMKTSQNMCLIISC